MPTANERVLAAAAAANLTIEVVHFDELTRTAPEAAEAVGCDVAQIVKSLCFTANGEPVMVLVSGANLMAEKKLAGVLGINRKKVKRATVEMVRNATGFVIGGVAPFGYPEPLPVYIDDDLLQHEHVWAAAGTPFTVFKSKTTDLVTACGGIVVDVKKE